MKRSMFILAITLATALAAQAEEQDESAAPFASHRHNHDGMMTRGGDRPANWTRYPTLKTRMSGESREERVVSVVPRNIVADSISASSNNLRDRSGVRALPIEMAGARLDKPEVGGFHWLFARESEGDEVRVASTVYNFGGHGAEDPTAMFMQQKNELEIIPQPYPREHSRYRAGETWKFLVRFNGQPLPSQKIVLETSNGSRIEAISDAAGVVTVNIPDDFKDVKDEPKASREKLASEKSAEELSGSEKPARSMGMGDRRRSGDFVLAAEYQSSDKNYLTTFNSAYGPNAYDGRSLALGLGFTLIGMIGATPLLRQRKPGEKKEAANAPATTSSQEA